MMPGFVRDARFWLGCFIAWFLALFVMSSFSGPAIGPPPFPHFDKVAHFGYFFGGGGLLAAFLYFRRPVDPSWWRIVLTVTLICAAAGAFDEWRQTFTPGRSGNDVSDWLADTLGGTAGALVFRLVHRWIK
jgi:VanZ family protein